MLDNKIIDSHEYFTQEDTWIILPIDFRNLLWVLWNELLLFIYKINQLPLISDEVFNVVDLDDTFYSRNHTLQVWLLNENRWEAGNRVIKEKMWWYTNFCEKFYKRNQVVQVFMDLLKEKTSLILTAWEEKFQNIKLHTIWYWIEKADKLVVKRDHEKPLSLLMHIINNLWYIPWTINIYDDRVKFFNKYAPMLSKLLKINININQVTLSEEKTNEISYISQTLYSSLLVKD